MRSQVILGFMAGIAVILSSAGCSKKSGEAVVLEKEHIAAREITPTPTTQQSATPSGPTPSPSESPSKEEEYKPRVLAEDEIVVDTYVMKKDVRGTSRDPRADTDETWIVKVQMVSDLRRIDVRTDRAHWDKVKVGDRINVSYRQGKYTGTVWHAEID
ncbi:MAG TPA: hypothetical protein VF345_15050 [Chthoniobacterales bacterium]